MAKRKAAPFIYGQSPNPHNWHLAAQALKDTSAAAPKPKAKSSGLMDRLENIERMLREKSHG